MCGDGCMTEQISIQDKAQGEMGFLDASKVPQLPKAFISYVEKKMKNGRGRPHLCKILGSMENILEFLKEAWIDRLSYEKLSKRYNVGLATISRFMEDVKKWRPQIEEYIIYTEEVEPRDFREIDIIKKWEQRIRRTGHLSALKHIAVMRNVLGYPLTKRQKAQGVKRYVKGFKCHPRKFDLEKAQQFVDLYLQQNHKKKLPQHIRLAIRHFLMVAKNIHIPRGFGQAYGLGGEKDSYGKHRFVRLTEEQIEKVREILKDDLEALTFFDWGIESLARLTPLCLTKMTFVRQGNVVTNVIFETKTKEKGRGGVFQKYLLLNIKHCRETWEEIQKLGAGRTYLFFDKKPNTSQLEKFKIKMSKKLKEAYRKAGVTEEYAYKKPFHFLRHTGAHLWLMRSNYDYGLVSELGWDDINTLRDCYGGLPPEILKAKILSIGED